jgi:Tfp pilus assembly protein PilE
MPPPSRRWTFRLRTLMIAVAVASLITVAYQGWRRHVSYARLAAFHARLRDMNLHLAAAWKADAEPWRETAASLRTRRARPGWEAEASRADENYRRWHDNEVTYSLQAEQHGRLSRLYVRAASRPWARVPPEPPLIARPGPPMEQALAERPE